MSKKTAKASSRLKTGFKSKELTVTVSQFCGNFDADA
jgi:hypothetical protein